jgi:hypothetical protein
MFRISDKVYHVFNMGKVGEVVDMKFVETGMHLVGGTAQQRLVLIVRFPDGRIMEVPADEAMKPE